MIEMCDFEFLQTMQIKQCTCKLHTIPKPLKRHFEDDKTGAAISFFNFRKANSWANCFRCNENQIVYSQQHNCADQQNEVNWTSVVDGSKK